MNNKYQKGIASFLSIIIIIAVGVVAIGGVLAYQYYWQIPDEEVEKEAEEPIDETTDWNVYRNEEYGFEFKYPDWNTGIIHDPSNPSLSIWTGTTSDEPCLSIGCAPRSGDRKKLTKRVAFQGEFGIYPSFKILIVKDTKWIEIQVTDTTTDCPSRDFCQEYIAKIDLKNKINDADYKVYNDFIDFLSTFKFIERGESYIKVISPNGGEQWEVGKTYNITWEQKEIDKIHILLVQKLLRHLEPSPEIWKAPSEGGLPQSCGAFVPIAKDILASAKKYSYTVPEGICLDEDYKIKIYIALSTTQYGKLLNESDNYFTIIKD